jgi:DNA-binding response OmpR family regulator
MRLSSRHESVVPSRVAGTRNLRPALAHETTRDNRSSDAPVLESSLTPMQAALQNYLRAHSGATLSREQLCQAVWRMKYFNSRTVDQTISVVRKHLAEDESIVTVFGVGYRHERAAQPDGRNSSRRPFR